MSHIPRITFIGAYEYDPTIFANLTLPDGINKNLAVNNFLLKYGECPMLYTDLRFQKAAFAVWSDKWRDGIARMLLALETEYNPLHNFDRYEEYTDAETIDRDTTDTGTDTLAMTGTITTAQDEDITIAEDVATDTDIDTTVTNEVSAYNSSAYQADNKTTTDSSTGETVNRDVTQSDDIDRTETHNRTNLQTKNLAGTEDIDRELEHSGHLYGNIGVTTSQQMLEAELDIRGKYNIYDIIAELLRSEFCLYCY